MNRMQSFEQSWAARHGVPFESMAQYRFESREGYRLPDMAAHYRTWCDALDIVQTEFDKLSNEVCRLQDEESRRDLQDLADASFREYCETES